LGRTELAPDDALRVLDHLEREGYEYHRVKWWATRRGERVRVWVYVYASRGLAARTRARRFAGVIWTPLRGTVRRTERGMFHVPDKIVMNPSRLSHPTAPRLHARRQA
jgi:hypothetical protein